MNDDQVSAALARLFQEGHRIIFWNDPDREFEDGIETLNLGTAKLLKVDGFAQLETKLRIERQEAEQQEQPSTPSDFSGTSARRE